MHESQTLKIVEEKIFRKIYEISVGGKGSAGLALWREGLIQPSLAVTYGEPTKRPNISVSIDASRALLLGPSPKSSPMELIN